MIDEKVIRKENIVHTFSGKYVTSLKNSPIFTNIVFAFTCWYKLLSFLSAQVLSSFYFKLDATLMHVWKYILAIFCFPGPFLYLTLMFPTGIFKGLSRIRVKKSVHYTSEII